MNKFISLMLLCAICLFSTGCLYVNVQFPMDDDFSGTDLGSKVGYSHSYSTLFHQIAWGDAGAAAAAKDGNIKTIKHADVKVFTVLYGIWSKVTTVVYGD